MSTIDDAEEQRFLQSVIYRHLEATGSARAQEILLNWQDYQPMVRKIAPKQAEIPAVTKQEQEAAVQ